MTGVAKVRMAVKNKHVKDQNVDEVMDAENLSNEEPRRVNALPDVVELHREVTPNQEGVTSEPIEEKLDDTLYVGKYRVSQILSHKGKLKKRTTLIFLVKWRDYEKTTWIKWSQARRLCALAAYISTNEQLAELRQHMDLARPCILEPNTGDGYALSTTDSITGQPLRYKQLAAGEDAVEWEEAHAEEFERLLTETETMRFIPRMDKPKDRKASYYNPQCSIKIKEGKEVKRVRGTIGGDRIEYPGEVAASTASLLTVKILLNKVLSEPSARFATADIKDYFLMSKLKRPEYMFIELKVIPMKIRIKYDLDKIAHEGKIMVEINGGIYGLPQAALLAQERLNQHLEANGYILTTNTPCLYKHITRPTMFTLIVDDFGISYHSQEDLDHFLNVLKKIYTITVGDGSRYLGFNLIWDYIARVCTLSIPDYVRKAILRFGIINPRVCDSPSDYVQHMYNRVDALINTVDESPEISPERRKRLEQIIGVFLYYAHAIDSTMLMKVTQLASLQANPTEAVEAAVNRFLEYAATWPNASIVFHASDMVLHKQSDASYLSESHGRSRVGGFSYLGTKAMLYEPNAAPSPINGAIAVRSSIIDVVVSSATEAEYAGYFINGKDAEVERTTLEDMGYPQGTTYIQGDNELAIAIGNDQVKQKRSRSMDMRFHWIRDRIRQQHLALYWRKGVDNLADFFTKNHPPKHFKAMRCFFLCTILQVYSIEILQGHDVW